MNHEPLQGVIFDIDGTLLDSNEAHARSWQEALKEHGHTVKFETVFKGIGMGGDQLLPALIGIESESTEGKRIAETRKKVFETKFEPALRPLPGARALVEALAAKGLKLAVATSAGEEELDRFLGIIGVTSLLHRKTTSDDAEHSKPEPDIIEAALKKLGLPKGSVVMIGDTPYDITAARRAGIATVAVRSGGRSDRDLEGAAEIYDDAADILEKLDHSPFFRKV